MKEKIDMHSRLVIIDCCKQCPYVVDWEPKWFCDLIEDKTRKEYEIKVNIRHTIPEACPLPKMKGYDYQEVITI